MPEVSKEASYKDRLSVYLVEEDTSTPTGHYLWLRGSPFFNRTGQYFISYLVPNFSMNRWYEHFESFDQERGKQQIEGPIGLSHPVSYKDILTFDQLLDTFVAAELVRKTQADPQAVSDLVQTRLAELRKTHLYAGKTLLGGYDKWQEYIDGFLDWGEAHGYSWTQMGTHDKERRKDELLTVLLESTFDRPKAVRHLAAVKIPPDHSTDLDLLRIFVGLNVNTDTTYAQALRVKYESLKTSPLFNQDLQEWNTFVYGTEGNSYFPPTLTAQLLDILIQQQLFGYSTALETYKRIRKRYKKDYPNQYPAGLWISTDDPARSPLDRQFKSQDQLLAVVAENYLDILS